MCNALKAEEHDVFELGSEAVQKQKCPRQRSVSDRRHSYAQSLELHMHVYDQPSILSDVNPKPANGQVLHPVCRP